jgi:hypothetical protein
VSQGETFRWLPRVSYAKISAGAGRHNALLEPMSEQFEYHQSFPQPSDPSVLAWRYMDLAKLMSMVLKRELYLRRLDLLPDRYEGLYPRRVRRALAEHYATHGLTENEAIEIANHRVDFSKETRQMMYVNCWHLGDYESEAMWRIYCGDDSGLAIVLSYENLRTLISTDSAWIGEVQYLDYESDLLSPGNAFKVALHKRIEFSHEKEARIVSFGNVAFATPADRPTAISIPWQVEAIQKIVVSPYAARWYLEMVRDVVERLAPGLGPRVVHSGMAAEPG